MMTRFRSIIVLSVLAMLTACPAPAAKQEINCAKDCPCECPGVDATTSAPASTPGEDAVMVDDQLPPKGESGKPWPVVLHGNVRIVEGALPKTEALKKITAQRLALRECYAAGLEKNPELRGEIEIQFTVSAGTGKIIAALVRDSTIKNKEVESCIEGKIRGWTFSSTKGKKESVVKFTLVLVPVVL